MYVSSVNSISETTMDFKLELYFREYWEEPRLSYSEDLYNNLTHIQLHESTAKQIWLPDTFIPNAVYSNNPKFESISHRFLLRLKPGGHIVYSRRISITAECPMDLSFYPFDKQACVVSIESYGHSTCDITYKWQNGTAVSMNEALQLPDFIITAVQTKTRNITLETGTYSRLECCFFFSRKSGYYIIQLFFPATAIVVTSWILLWLDKQATLGDMIEVIIAITFLYFSYASMMPGVSYVKATDVFLGACFLFVFLAFLKMSHGKMRANSRQPKPILENERAKSLHDDKPEFYFPQNEVPVDTGLLKADAPGKPWSEKKRSIFGKALSAKRRSILIFPLSFCVFCLGYFLVYLVLVTDKSHQRCQF